MWKAKCHCLGDTEFSSHWLHPGMEASMIARWVTVSRWVHASASATIAPMSCPHTAYRSKPSAIITPCTSAASWALS